MEIQPNFIKQVNNYVYALDKPIGKGTNSTVYKGRLSGDVGFNTITKEIVAIKVIDTKAIRGYIYRMLIGYELKALATIHHDNVIKCFEVCQTTNNMYIVMEFCYQGNLQEYVRNCTSPDMKTRYEFALTILEGLMKGLSDIHHKGFLHRDIKTANVMIRGMVPKIGDFGYCIPIAEVNGKPTYNVGSPLYMSPYCYKKSNYSAMGDIWSLGVILYEMLIGSQPFQGLNYDAMVEAVRSGYLFQNLCVSQECLSILKSMLSVDVLGRSTLEELLILIGNRKKPENPSKLSNFAPASQKTEKPKSKMYNEITFAPLESERRPPLSHVNTPRASKINSPIKHLYPLKSQIVSKYPQDQSEHVQRQKLHYVLCSIFHNFNQYDNYAGKQLAPLCLKQIIHNQKVLKQPNQQIETMCRLCRYDHSEPFFDYLLEKIQPETQTWLDYALFWLRTAIKKHLNILNRSNLVSLHFLFLIKYCQILDYMRLKEDSSIIWPYNEVLDCLIDGYRDVTSDGIEYLRSITDVLLNDDSY